MSKRSIIIPIALALVALGLLFRANEGRRISVQRTTALKALATSKAESKPVQAAAASPSSSVPQWGYSEEEYNFLRKHYKPNQLQADGPLPADRLGLLAKIIQGDMEDDQKEMWPVVKDVIYGNASAIEDRLDAGRLSADATFYLDYPYNNLHSLLDAAIEAGQRGVIKVLLQHGANVNTQKFYASNGESIPIASPFTIAARNGEDDVVRQLLERGADINQVAGFGPGGDSDTALHAAVYSGDPSTVCLLLANGADVKTALGRGGMVPEILRRGAMISPRMAAVSRLLLDYGAKMPPGNDVGASPRVK
ncbi:MAG TPA: ankyrin repeat domain-containing protein [Steroidobacteraceae bacterium]|nr:ankyrin repeat domain-containing protein [Steroidobacteraceae bacterium]